MAKILYIPCHSVLEHDEVKLLHELGHDVFAMDSYRNPASPIDPKRPPIEGMEYHEYLDRLVSQSSRENLHEELIDWADIIIWMHMPQWVMANWGRVKHKKNIFRSIGQSSPTVESMLAVMRIEGLKVVRYSPAEQRILGYVGEDAVIRFYKDPEEFNGYTGEIPKVVTMAQSMKLREPSCNYKTFMESTDGFDRTIYGPGNEDTGLDGGRLSYDELKEQYRKNQVYFYTGTYPASYTLNFIEAFMTGIPIVAIGRQLANIDVIDTYEVDTIIENGVSGYVGNNISELRQYVKMLMEDKEACKRIGAGGRKRAIELFGKNTIKQQWYDFLNAL